MMETKEIVTIKFPFIISFLLVNYLFVAEVCAISSDNGLGIAVVRIDENMDKVIYDVYFTGSYSIMGFSILIEINGLYNKLNVTSNTFLIVWDIINTTHVGVMGISPTEKNSSLTLCELLFYGKPKNMRVVEAEILTSEFILEYNGSSWRTVPISMHATTVNVSHNNNHVGSNKTVGEVIRTPLPVETKESFSNGNKIGVEDNYELSNINNTVSHADDSTNSVSPLPTKIIPQNKNNSDNNDSKKEIKNNIIVVSTAPTIKKTLTSDTQDSKILNNIPGFSILGFVSGVVLALWFMRMWEG